MRTAFVSTLLCLLAADASAQSNKIDGLDALLNSVRDPEAMGREGTFPDGRNGISIETSVCNIGSVEIDWNAAMKEKHPFIAFIIGREANGRFEQISDRSFVKHGFFSTNTSLCDNCDDPGDNSLLGIDCSDTYSSGNNGDRFWLGPATEIDPWLGTWVKECSHFDRGEPPVPPPEDCDGKRSFDQGQVNDLGPVTHRMEVSDADLNDPNATYYFYGIYVVLGEAEELRLDNGGSKKMVPTWTGSQWDLQSQGGLLRSSILRRWSGSQIHDNSNGTEDGRVFLASKVTGPDVNGMYHYEYAMHNRDNSRGISSFEIPLCPGATIANAGFGDIDADATNDWTLQVGSTKATWSTAVNPLEWNTIYNFWFDSDAPPASDAHTLVSQFRAGAGFSAFDLIADAPLGPPLGVDLGFGKAGGNGVAPYLEVCGGYDIGQQANLTVRYAAPSSMGFLFLSDENTGFDFRGGRIVPFPMDLLVPMCTDAFGEIYCPFDGAGGSLHLYLQLLVLDLAATGEVALTNALEVTL